MDYLYTLFFQPKSKMVRLTCYLLLGCFSPLLVIAQDATLISGTWKGNYGKNSVVVPPKELVAEFFLYNDSLVTGATHLYYHNGNSEHYKINGVYRAATSTVEFSEDNTVALRLGPNDINCTGLYSMRLIKGRKKLRLEGVWKSKGISSLNCPVTSVWLERSMPKDSEPAPPPIVTAPQQAKDTGLLPYVARKMDIQSLLEIKPSEKDSIRIDVYDNAEIDDDTVTVFYNDVPLIQKARISATPLTFYISLNELQPIGKLKLIAENLGTIPPCTAFMVITTKQKRYELSLASDFSKNGVLEFFLKE